MFVAGFAWLAFGITELVIGIIAVRAAGAGVADEISSELGDDVVAGGGTQPTESLLPIVVGAVMIALMLALIARKGWARLALAALGALAVIDFAVRGQWQALLAMALLLVSVVPTMSPTMHRYLYGHKTPPSAS